MSRLRGWVSARSAGLAQLVFIAVVTAVLGVMAWQVSENAKTRDGVCELRRLDQKALAETDAFLDDADAVRAAARAGITRDLLERGQANRRATISALSGLGCSEPEEGDQSERRP